MHNLEPNIEIMLVKSPPGDRDLEALRGSDRHIGHASTFASLNDTKDRRADDDIRRRPPIVGEFRKKAQLQRLELVRLNRGNAALHGRHQGRRRSLFFPL